MDDPPFLFDPLEFLFFSLHATRQPEHAPHCSASQENFPGPIITELPGPESLVYLPNKILLKILLRLPRDQRLNLALTCKRLLRLAAPFLQWDVTVFDYRLNGRAGNDTPKLEPRSTIELGTEMMSAALACAENMMNEVVVRMPSSEPSWRRCCFLDVLQRPVRFRSLAMIRGDLAKGPSLSPEAPVYPSRTRPSEPMSRSNLRSLYLEGVDNPGIDAVLKAHPSLEYLSIHGCKMSEDSRFRPHTCLLGLEFGRMVVEKSIFARLARPFPNLCVLFLPAGGSDVTSKTIPKRWPLRLAYVEAKVPKAKAPRKSPSECGDSSTRIESHAKQLKHKNLEVVLYGKEGRTGVRSVERPDGQKVEYWFKERIGQFMQRVNEVLEEEGSGVRLRLPEHYGAKKARVPDQRKARRG